MAKKPFMLDEFPGRTRIRIVGIDPGLVDTGVVAIHLDRVTRSFSSTVTTVKGLDADELALAIQRTKEPGYMKTSYTFIEKYRPRSNFNTDTRMIGGVRDFAKVVENPVILDNTGVKKIILPKTLDALRLRTFSTYSHHQDLRSAAAIALLGMVKNDTLNSKLYDILESASSAGHWSVHGPRYV